MPPSGRSAAQLRGRSQALDHLAVFQVRLDDFLDVGRVHVAVPDALRVHHRHRTGVAPVQAAGAVHAHTAGAGQAGALDQLLAMVKSVRIAGLYQQPI